MKIYVPAATAFRLVAFSRVDMQADKAGGWAEEARFRGKPSTIQACCP